MNIIKLKDVIMPDSMPQAEYFNKYLKGRYAYWVQMRYIVSFDHMRHEGYVACEEDITKLLQREDGKYPKPYGAPCMDVYAKDVYLYVDSNETDKCNNTVEFRMKNKYVTDENITLNELKTFRTWLASEILKMDQTELGEQKKSFLTDTDTHVMEYYAHNMYDNTVKILSEFGSVNVNYYKLSTDCGCSGSTDLNSLYSNTLTTCDPLSIYRRNIYNRMLELFSSIDFWTQWPLEFIGVFKRYIDNIISTNLPLSNSTYMNEYTDCVCAPKDNQTEFVRILNRLSLSLGYIQNNEINGHKNYIKDALRDWASQLYENMYW